VVEHLASLKRKVFRVRAADPGPTATRSLSTRVFDSQGAIVTGQRRLLYLDNLKWLIILAVIVGHSALTYWPGSPWFYHDPGAADPVFTGALLVLGALLEAFAMGLLFLISGYFVPGSYERKGMNRFLLEKSERLGIPSLIFMLLIAPVGLVLLYPPTGASPVDLYVQYLSNPLKWMSGPLWFVIALLFFTACYALLVRTRRWEQFTGPLTDTRIIFLISIVAVSTFIVRTEFPVGVKIWNMRLCYFSQYVAFFLFGILAYRNRWLSSVTVKQARTWLLIAVLSTAFLLAPSWYFGGALSGGLSPFLGGLTWQSAMESTWEQVFGMGVILWLLVWFRDRHDRQRGFESFLSRNAYAAYVFHSPVLVAFGVLLTSYSLPGLIKWPILAALGVVVTFLLCSLVIRKIPGLRRILYAAL
jgi:glucan biosynthesis protein C